MDHHAGGMDHGNINISVGRRVHRSVEQWARLIDAQRGSGLSIAAFCRGQEVGANSFHRWRRRLAGSMDPGAVPGADSGSADRPFVRLRVPAADVPIGAPSSVVVRFVDGVELRVDGERLADLVTLLRGGSTDRGAP